MPSEQKTSTSMTPRPQAYHVDATYSYGKYVKTLIDRRGSGSLLSAAIYAGRRNNARARAKQSVDRLSNTRLLCKSASRIPPGASVASSSTFQKKKKKNSCAGIVFRVQPCKHSTLPSLCTVRAISFGGPNRKTQPLSHTSEQSGIR